MRSAPETRAAACSFLLVGVKEPFPGIDFYRIEFCLLAVGKTKNDLLVVLLDHLIINEKESEGLWWSTAIHVISDSGRRRS